MENAMGNTTLHEALFMLGRVNVWRTSTAGSFLTMAHSYFLSNPTLAIDDTIKTNIINSLVAIAHFLVSLDPKLSCCKNIEDKSPLSLAIEMGNTDVLEYILRSLPCGISWSSGKSLLQVVIKKRNLVLKAPNLVLRMENAMGNTALNEALFMLGRVNVWRISTAGSFLTMARSYFLSNPTLAIDDTIKTNIINSFVAIAHFLVSLDPKLSYCKNIEDKSPLSLAIEMGNTDVLEYILRSLPSVLKAPNLVLRMENAMGNTALHEALFMLGRVNVWRTSTAGSFLTMARSYFLSNPTLAIDDTIKTNIINSLVAIVHFVVSLDPKLSYCKNIEDKSPLSLAIEMGNTDVLEYILRSLPCGISWSSGKSPLQVVIKKINLDVLQLINQHKPEVLLLEDRNGNISLRFAPSYGYLEGVCYLLEGVCYRSQID
ncbi:hypothetical protein WN944_015990 [Citrus x changshan-huyou]|uniref:Ankyrin repeat protein n=1 Tax=Citrus x changshan-huyou TaxID=2935761 RepID=A0AAP0M8I9_9ROSI